MVRRMGAWMLRGSIKLLTGLTITDCTSGFRAANRRVIRAFAHWYPEDYPEPEVILLLHRAGYRISELAVRMRRRSGGRSSINLLDGAFYVMKVTVCLLLDLVREPWPRGKVVDHEPDRSGHEPLAREHPTREPRRGVFRHLRGATRRATDTLPQPVPGGLRWDAPAAGPEATPHV
jgi:hypothetical protein